METSFNRDYDSHSYESGFDGADVTSWKFQRGRAALFTHEHSHGLNIQSTREFTLSIFQRTIPPRFEFFQYRQTSNNCGSGGVGEGEGGRGRGGGREDESGYTVNNTHRDINGPSNKHPALRSSCLSSFANEQTLLLAASMRSSFEPARL